MLINDEQFGIYVGGNSYAIVEGIVLASRASGCHLYTQTLKNHPSEHPKYFVRNFLKCRFQAYHWIFHLNIIPKVLYMDIMHHFIELI